MKRHCPVCDEQGRGEVWVEGVEIYADADPWADPSGRRFECECGYVWEVTMEELKQEDADIRADRAYQRWKEEGL